MKDYQTVTEGPGHALLLKINYFFKMSINQFAINAK